MSDQPRPRCRFCFDTGRRYIPVTRDALASVACPHDGSDDE